ncbi:TPA: hypothetical protein HA238_06120 [Candidatus Micrarchaeota archaeon]|nr:hypothetical protein [Candidatus Micrarchaeota archaeon]
MNSGLKFVFAFFALSMLVMAQGGELKELKNNVLVAKYDQVACRASFYDGILQDAKDLGLGSRYNISVDALREKIGTDLVALKSAAENADRKGFLDAMQLLLQDGKDVVLTYNDVKNAVRKDKDMRLALRKSFVDNKQKMAECLRENALHVGKAQIDYVKEWRARQLERIKKLKEKGIDTTNMSDVVSEADEKVSELEDAVSTGDGQNVIEKEKELRQRHLHIWARYQVASIDAVLSKMNDRAVAMGYDEDVEDIRALLADVTDKTMPGKAYDQGDFETVVKELKDAAQKLRVLYKKITQGSAAAATPIEIGKNFTGPAPPEGGVLQ